MKAIYFLLLFACSAAHCSATTTNCDLRDTKYGSVCVCTKTHCDYLDEPQPSGDNELVVISSSKAGLRFSTTAGNFAQTTKLLIKNRSQAQTEEKKNFEGVESLVVEGGRSFLQLANKSTFEFFDANLKTVNLEVKREIQFQKVVSFGGAITGAVSHVLDQVDESLQDHVYRSFFHKSGINFNTVRIPIGGCDFDTEPWAYNEEPRDDARLSNFTRLAARDIHRVQQLIRLKTIAELSDIKIMAAAWSPPKWMKSNEEWTGLSHLKPEYYQTWADYHLKFLDLMNAKNMPIWAISTGNEPLNGVVGWFFVHFMSLGWTTQNQAVWLSDHLGPTIRNSQHKNVLIFGNDDQRYTYPEWFRKMKGTRADALDYLDGLAVHWYWDDVFSPTLIDEAHKDMPDKLILNTESSVGDKPWQTHGPELGSWTRGEQYMRGFLQDFQHHVNGWIDWNIVLDEQGGPNYVNNHVDAPVIVNTTNHAEFYKQPIYYAMGHFSKFVTEHAQRIETNLSGVALDAVGFQRPDGRIVLVVYNGENTSVDLALNDSRRGHVVLNLPARSWHTIVYN